MLLYTAEGKLLAHNASKDAVDPERVKRLEDVRKWIEAVKQMKGGNGRQPVPRPPHAAEDALSASAAAGSLAATRQGARRRDALP